MNNEIVCNCAICEQPIHQHELDGETVSDNYVYKCGELQYIELFHTTCEEE